MIRFSPHLEILPEVQRWIYPRLQNLKNLGLFFIEEQLLRCSLVTDNPWTLIFSYMTH